MKRGSKMKISKLIAVTLVLCLAFTLASACADRRGDGSMGADNGRAANSASANGANPNMAQGAVIGTAAQGTAAQGAAQNSANPNAAPGASGAGGASGASGASDASRTSGSAGVAAGKTANQAGTPTVALLSTAALNPDELYLHAGSPIALSDGKILPLDRDDPGIAAMIYMDRTLVPLRFVSEYFGAEVDYDGAARAGIVQTGGHTARFPVGESYFTLDGQRIELDTKTLLTSGRIMLPLRALCEQVLGLSVDYSNGVIQIGKDAKLDSDSEKAVKSKIGMYVKTTDLDSLKRYIDEFGNYSYYFTYDDIPTAEVESVDDSAMKAPTGTVNDSPAEAPAGSAANAPEPVPSAGPVPQAPPQPGGDEDRDFEGAGMEDIPLPQTDGGAGESGHSATNTQVEGVDESDIIKTDGKYIYLMSYNNVRIIDASGAMSAAAKISLPNDNLSDMYIDDGRLIVIGFRWNDSGIVYGDPAPGKAFSRPSRGMNTAFVNVYDTTDMSDIKLIRGFEIEGDVVTTRKQNGYLYLLTTMYHRYDSMDPRPRAGEDGKIAPIPLECIMIAPGCYTEGFMTLSAINIIDSDEAVSSETITTGGYSSTHYMSNNAMYIASRDYSYGDVVSIAKFSIAGGKIGYAGSGSVNGGLNDQFSMDEHRGYLRVATTEWGMTQKNNLYVLDGNMQVCGSVLGFAPDERIYSARFMGDRGYIVTFRQMDPLFVFDLSDPMNPKITGELKVPGFSSYLHPVSENVILGVGNDVQDIYTRDRNGNEIVVGQRTGGIKLSLFDVSDMGKPKEIDTLILGEGGYSELLYNHKAAMFRQDEGIVAFCADLYGNDKDGDFFNGALIISYAGNVLSERGRIASAGSRGSESEIYYGDSYDFYGQRLVYIGSTLYYAGNGSVRSFDWDTLALKQTLRLW